MYKKASVFIMIMGIGCLSGCGSHTAAAIDTKVEEVMTVPEADEILQNEAKAPQKEETTTEIPEVVVPDVTMQRFKIPENEALTFVKHMKIGWNLGNTFDANTEGSQLGDEMTYESYWCKVKTTKEMIDTLKQAGFNTVRIPISWHNHLADEEFAISQEWMNRVQEVVDYVIDNEMYAIINIHHDISKDYYYPSSDCLESSTKYVTSIWTQIGERFKDYDEHLIFESVNEPRLVGDANEWWFQAGQENCKDAAACINTLNQVFVDTVRKTGSYNEERYLMVPGYDAAPDPVIDESFKLPDDIQENKIIVSVHAYTPYAFALQNIGEAGSTDTWDITNSKDQKSVTDFMDGLYNKFVAKGTPVVIGEFGARDKQGNLQDRVNFASYYIAAAKMRGMSCLWWDNNSFTGNGENFGLLDRSTNTWQYEELLKGLMKYAD